MAAFYYSYSESDPPPALAGLGKSSPCLESVLATGVVPPLAPLLPTPPKEQTHEPQRAT